MERAYMIKQEGKGQSVKDRETCIGEWQIPPWIMTLPNHERQQYMVCFPLCVVAAAPLQPWAF